MHSKTQTKWIISEFSCWCFSSRSSFLCERFCRLLRDTRTLSQCSLVSISSRCCELEWNLAGLIWLQDLLARHALGFSNGPSSLRTRRRSGNRLIARSKQRYEKELVFGLTALCCRAPFVATSVVHGWFVDPYWVQCRWNALEANFSKIITLSLVIGFREGASSSSRAAWGTGTGFSSYLCFTTG